MRWLERPPAGVDVEWHLQPSGSGGSSLPFNEQGQRIGGMTAQAGAFPADAKSCSIRISVARGEWATLAETDGETVSGVGTGKYTFAFAPSSERRNMVILTVSHNVAGRALRIIAVDTERKTLAVGLCNGSGGRGFMQTWAQFPKEKMQGVLKFLVQAATTSTTRFATCRCGRAKRRSPWW